MFAEGDWITEDDFGGDGVAFEDFRLLDDLWLVKNEGVRRMGRPDSLYCLRKRTDDPDADFGIIHRVNNAVGTAAIRNKLGRPCGAFGDWRK